MWTTIRQFNTARFSVVLQYEDEEYIDIHDYAPNIRNSIVRGDYDLFTFRVVVLGDGRIELGAEYLNDAIYADPKDFAREHLNGPAHFPDMLRAAITETRKIIAALQQVRIAPIGPSVLGRANAARLAREAEQ